MLRSWLKALLLCFLVLTAAVTADSAQGWAQSLEPARIEPVTVAGDDTAVMFSTEIADTEPLRERGLMFRHFLPEGHAMLFDFGRPRPVAMWMKNTNIPLDMLFIRDDGTIAAIAENTVPQSLDRISVQEPIRAVLELPAGTVKAKKITKDDKVYNGIFKTGEE